MKNIDVKSLLIGVLATALLFACADADKALPSIVSEAKAATGVNDKWDDKQQWETGTIEVSGRALRENAEFILTTDKDRMLELVLARSTKHTEWPTGWEPIGPGLMISVPGEGSKGVVWNVRKRIK